MTDETAPPPPVHAEATAKAKALSHPIRWRILRLCAHEPRTNQELAALLDVAPGSMLHHVRSLVETGFLAAEEPRRGTRGAKEIPYRATGLTWRDADAPLAGPVLIATFLEEIQGVRPTELEVSRLGVRLTSAMRDEYRSRAADLLEWVKAHDDADGEPISIMLATHPDVQQG